jgi:hypothetical protein
MRQSIKAGVLLSNFNFFDNLVWILRGYSFFVWFKCFDSV